MRAAEADMLRQQLSQTDSHQLTVELKSLKERRDELTEKVKTCETAIKEGQQKVCIFLSETVSHGLNR